MSSFGEGYATRSDEEGFGGIYGGNQEDEEKIVHGNTPGNYECTDHFTFIALYMSIHCFPMLKPRRLRLRFL